MGHGTFCSKKLLGHSITKSPKSIGSSHIFFAYTKKKKTIFLRKVVGSSHAYPRHFVGPLLDIYEKICW